MSNHEYEDQIKRKLLDVQIDHFRKNIIEQRSSYQRHSHQLKNYPSYDISEWATHDKTFTFTSFPQLKSDPQSSKKNHIMESSPNTIKLESFFTKTNFKSKNKTSLPIQINLSFSPFQSQRSKKKVKRKSSMMGREQNRVQQRSPLNNYLINGQIKMINQQNKEMNNSACRSDHLLRLLRQRQLLRTKRYSFDIEKGFMTKGHFCEKSKGVFY